MRLVYIVSIFNILVGASSAIASLASSTAQSYRPIHNILKYPVIPYDPVPYGVMLPVYTVLDRIF